MYQKYGGKPRKLPLGNTIKFTRSISDYSMQHTVLCVFFGVGGVQDTGDGSLWLLTKLAYHI